MIRIAIYFVPCGIFNQVIGYQLTNYSIVTRATAEGPWWYSNEDDGLQPESCLGEWYDNSHLIIEIQMNSSRLIYSAGMCQTQSARCVYPDNGISGLDLFICFTWTPLIADNFNCIISHYHYWTSQEFHHIFHVVQNLFPLIIFFFIKTQTKHSIQIYVCWST